MEHHRRPHLLSLSAPARPVSTSPVQHRPSQSPFRYVHFPEMTEKETPLADLADRPHYTPSSARFPPSPYRPSRFPPSPRRSPPPTPSTPLPGLPPSLLRRIGSILRPWLPIILYGLSSLTFVVAIAFFKTQVFTLLDNLSAWLRIDVHFGYAVLFVLIFLTTFPPVPMYSTLIILSGYTFGPWVGATISYFAALTGALTVFLLSRTLLHDCISRWLESTGTIKRVVRAVEKRPKLLFFVRLAPYPYNMMNCLLAASPTLTLKTYTICTAASLFKVIIHTSLGASIHSFKDYHTTAADGEENAGTNTVARMYTIGGIVLCVVIFIYISIIARRAVHQELGDEPAADSEERIAFLSPGANGDEESGRPMVQLHGGPHGR